MLVWFSHDSQWKRHTGLQIVLTGGCLAALQGYRTCRGIECQGLCQIPILELNLSINRLDAVIAHKTLVAFSACCKHVAQQGVLKHVHEWFPSSSNHLSRNRRRSILDGSPAAGWPVFVELPYLCERRARQRDGKDGLDWRFPCPLVTQTDSTYQRSERTLGTKVLELAFHPQCLTHHAFIQLSLKGTSSKLLYKRNTTKIVDNMTVARIVSLRHYILAGTLEVVSKDANASGGVTLAVNVPILFTQRPRHALKGGHYRGTKLGRELILIHWANRKTAQARRSVGANASV